MKTITICSSVNFYKQVIDVQAQLEELGYRAIIPLTAEKMKKTGDFDVEHVKTWYKNDADYHKKADLMRSHFNEVARADAVLVLNYEKHGEPNYIGGNVLMEMSLAFYLNKPIYILNEIPEQSKFIEEIRGMRPIVLNGKLKTLLSEL